MPALLEEEEGGECEKEHGRDGHKITGGVGKSYRALELTLAFTLQSVNIRGLKGAWWHNSSLTHSYPLVWGMPTPLFLRWAALLTLFFKIFFYCFIA